MGRRERTVVEAPDFEVYAVRYATREARRSEHFYSHDPHDGPMPPAPEAAAANSCRGAGHPEPAGGGGGFGAPAERDPTQVARDVADGLVSVERAREVYGVVLTDSDQHAERSADIEASSRLREEASSKEARRG